MNFNDIDSCSGDTPIFLFRLFLINEKNFLGLLLRSGDTDNCMQVLNGFLLELQDCLAASWYFDHSESSFVLLNLLYALSSMDLCFTLMTYPCLAESWEGHST